MHNERSRSRGSEKGNSAHSGLLFLWRRYLHSLRLLPKCRVWIPDFMGATSCLASLPLSSAEVGFYFSSSNSRKSQGCSEICFPRDLPSILCFHTDTKTHSPSGTQEAPTRSQLRHISLKGSLRVLSWQGLQRTGPFVIADSDMKYTWRRSRIYYCKKVEEDLRCVL